MKSLSNAVKVLRPNGSGSMSDVVAGVEWAAKSHIEKVKAAKDGKHKTSVDQDVRGAVTEEHVHPHQHENVTTAVDKEVHQHHHQTRIQPVKHEEVL